MIGWAAALCFLLAGVVLLSIGFLAYDSYKHREAKRRPMATSMPVDELMLRRLKKSVSIRIAQRDIANGR